MSRRSLRRSTCQVSMSLLLAAYDIFVRDAWDCAGHRQAATRRQLSCCHPGLYDGCVTVGPNGAGQPPATNKNKKCCVRPSCSAANCNL